MSARAIAIHGYKMSGEQRANLEIKSECPALTFCGYKLFKIFLLSGYFLNLSIKQKQCPSGKRMQNLRIISFLSTLCHKMNPTAQPRAKEKGKVGKPVLNWTLAATHHVVFLGAQGASARADKP